MMTETLSVHGGGREDYFKLPFLTNNPDQTLMPLDRNEGFVEVPNTEFVALIVGKNGHKIKEIRERTGTFIKTPMRNEPPVFKIGGTAQNVAKAVKEINEIVERLKSPQYRFGAFLSADGTMQGPRVTIEVRVPFKFVGLVVGFQGSTVMEIQHQSKTHIQTPAHGGQPIFEVTGGSLNVILAKFLINFHIERRTGLSVLEIDTLLEEQVNANWLSMIQNFGLTATINAINKSQSDFSAPSLSESPFGSAYSSSSSYAAALSPQTPSSTSSSDPFDSLTRTFVGLSTNPKPWTADLDIHRKTDLLFFGGEVDQQYQLLNEPRRSPRPIVNTGALAQEHNQIDPLFNALAQPFTLHPISSLFPEEINDEQFVKTTLQPAREQSLNFGGGATNFWDNLAQLSNLPADQVL